MFLWLTIGFYHILYIVGINVTNKPESVEYSKLPTLLLKEVQDLKQENDMLKDCITNSKDFAELKICSAGVGL